MADPNETEGLAEHRLDSWFDDATGFTTRTTASFNREGSPKIRDISDLYDASWLARRIVDLPPAEALKGGFKLGNDAQEKAVKARDRSHLFPEGWLRRGLQMGRLRGGALIFVLPDTTETGRASDPWRPTDGCRRVEVVAWDDCIVTFQDDVNSAEVGLPITYTPVDGSLRGVKIHASRAIICEGATRAHPTRERPWISVLEPVFAALADHGMSWGAVTQLIKEASIMWLKMQGVHAAIANGNVHTQTQASQGARNRIKFMQQSKNVLNTLILDPTEDVGRVAVSFADLPTLMQEINLLISGAAETPATKLFGRAPAGMNATGESDLNNWYDRLETYRIESLEAKIGRYCELITGSQPTAVTFEPLRTPTASEKATLRKTNFEGDEALWRMNMLKAERILLSRLEDGSLGITLPEESIELLRNKLATEGDFPEPEEPKEPEVPVTTPPAIPNNPEDDSDADPETPEVPEDASDASRKPPFGAPGSGATR